jgi:hypothetical protein
MKIIRLAAAGAAVCICLLIVTHREPVQQGLTVTWEDGTTVEIDRADGWTRARYSDGTECMWRDDNQAANRCIDATGKPIKLAPLAPLASGRK